jgi:hypothetical protein
MYEDAGKNKISKQNLLKLAYQETDARTTKQEITGADGGPLQRALLHKPSLEGLFNPIISK